MTELEKSLQSHFGVIDSHDLEIITSQFKSEKIEKGGCFLVGDKVCDRFSFIKSGILRVFVNNGDREITQWVATNGFLTDLSSFIFEKPARWTIQALTDVELLTIRKREYKRLHELIPKWIQLENIFIIHCFTTLEDRIFSHLSMTAEERYQFFFENHKELFNQIPLQYIASMLGMTPETFSRIRNKK